LPQLQGLPEYHHLLQILNAVRAGDRNPKPTIRREGPAKENVRFKVGQVFKHKRFRYMGVVIGWDVNCDASEEWMAQMGVDELGRGRWQSFYHVL
jgi:F-box protein 21